MVRRGTVSFPESRDISRDKVKGNVSTRGSVNAHVAGLSGFEIHESSLHLRAGCQLAKLPDVLRHPTSTFESAVK